MIVRCYSNFANNNNDDNNNNNNNMIIEENNNLKLDKLDMIKNQSIKLNLQKVFDIIIFIIFNEYFSIYLSIDCSILLIYN